MKVKEEYERCKDVDREEGLYGIEFCDNDYAEEKECPCNYGICDECIYFK